MHEKDRLISIQHFLIIFFETLHIQKRLFVMKIIDVFTFFDNCLIFVLFETLKRLKIGQFFMKIVNAITFFVKF